MERWNALQSESTDLNPALWGYLAPMSEPSKAFPFVHLHPGKEKSLLRGHPWVFSGAIQRIEVDDAVPAPGDWVCVISSKGQALGWGHWGAGSIAVRIIASGSLHAPPDSSWWAERIAECLAVRQSVGLGPGTGTETDCCRLVHGEGDGLSGLVVDWYAGMAVVQTHSMGMHRAWPELSAGLQAGLGSSLNLIVNKSAALIAKLPGVEEQVEDGTVWSSDSKTSASAVREVSEHGIRYKVSPIDGQKTGFFLDQRDNRLLLMQCVQDRAVLNAFSYTGGFSLAALQGGSPHVISLDASEKAVNAACHHAEINGYADQHEGVQGDVMSYLRQCETLPPVVVLDPPAYAKSRSARHKAVQGYKRLNAEALKKMPKAGLLWTFSCSQVVDAQLFEDTIVAAAVESGRTVRILRRLGQPADHPTRAGHPEARYLKGLVLHID